MMIVKEQFQVLHQDIKKGWLIHGHMDTFDQAADFVQQMKDHGMNRVNEWKILRVEVVERVE